jgi:ABC-type nickel/cobalt efflux system permease component RcnA
MLIALGAQVLLRMRRGGVHFHVHEHGDGNAHLHAHRHAPREPHDPHRHEHAHAPALPVKAAAVGMVHGLAGSAALVLLTLTTVGSLGWGLASIALFGLGSMLGMAALSSAIARPLQASARRLGRLHAGVEALVALVTVALGARLVYEMGRRALGI